MPKEFKECVRKVSRGTMRRYGYMKYNPYAVCRKSTGYYGSTRHKRRHHRKHNTILGVRVPVPGNINIGAY